MITHPFRDNLGRPSWPCRGDSAASLLAAWRRAREQHLHLVRAPYKDQWRTPFRGTLGKGFPDLLLVRGNQVLFVELKAEGGKLTPDQQRVLDILRPVGAGVAVWFPSYWDEIMEVLA